MKKSNLKFSCVLVCLNFFSNYNVYAQVGIGTTNPQQELHIAGNSSTIRIEGLNNVNHSLNDGVKLSPVHVNAQGDLVLATPKPSAAVSLVGSSVVSPAIELAGSSVTTTLRNGSFTTANDGFVGLSFSMTVDRVRQTNSQVITDGRPRVVAVLIYVDNVLVARASDVYTSRDGTGVIAVGFIVLNGHDYLDLTAGNHTYRIDAKIYGGSHPFQAFFGGSAAFNHFKIVEF